MRGGLANMALSTLCTTFLAVKCGWSMEMMEERIVRVTTSNGVVDGIDRVGDGVVSWIGIPFGASTGGSARFGPPRKPPAWATARDCTADSTRYCPQPDGDATMESEDCLTLSVWRPPFTPSQPSPSSSSGTTAAKLPVLVWIFGGGFAEGSSDDWALRNLTLASAALGSPTIVIAMNYRVGGLGFLALPELSGPATSNGNLGMLDQRLALRWVQDEIANFGGDQTRVAIWGQSAGGQSVCFHLASPDSAGLFSRAISSSGPCILPYPTLAEAEAQGAEWATSVGCGPGPDRLGCLRRVPARRLVTAGLPRKSPHDGFLYPVIDGTPAGYPEDNGVLFRAGRFNRVPTLFGSADDDLGGSFADGLVPRNLSAAAFPKYLSAVADAVALGDDFLAELRAVYPLSRRGNGTRASTDSPAYATLLDLVGDSNIGCTAFDSAGLIAAAKTDPPATYAYNFIFRAPQMGGEALHASDLPFFFGDSGEFDAPRPFSAREAGVVTAMQQELLHFVAKGRPVTVAWLPLGTDANHATVMVFGAAAIVDPSWKAQRCALWRQQRTATRWLGDAELKKIFQAVKV